MIVKLDKATEDALDQLQKAVAAETGMLPQSKSLVAQALLQWACGRMAKATLRALAPQMLSLAQQRKAVIGELRARQGQMDEQQLKRLRKAMGSLSGDVPKGLPLASSEK